MGTYIEWKDGMPYPAYAEPITAEKAEALIRAVASVKYEPRYKCSPLCPDTGRPYCINEDHYRSVPASEERFRGMTLLEVGEIRRAEAFAHGDLAAGKDILDRIIGKPKQTVQTMQLAMSYKDYLGMVAEKRKKELEEKRHAELHFTKPTTEAPDAVTVEVVDNPLDGL